VSDEQSVTDDPSEQTPEQRRALFRVIRGGPDDAEVAALTAVLAAAASAASSAGGDEDDRGRSVWIDRAAMVRGPLPVGPGAWRNSVWPR
jgi:hypothetical protein